MSNRILIRNITNLTDARYFAAMQVDWISMQLTDDPLSFSKWHTIKEWISGVRMAAELNTDDESVIARAIIDAQPEGMIVDHPDFIHLLGGMNVFLLTENIKHTLSDEIFARIVPYENYKDLSPLAFPQNIFLEADWTPDGIQQLINSDYRGGICFSGGEESELGMRDYSQLDKILEMLRK